MWDPTTYQQKPPKISPPIRQGGLNVQFENFDGGEYLVL
jgi:hypothetical protein